MPRNRSAPYQCSECKQVFSRKSAVQNHWHTVHEAKVACDLCGKRLPRVDLGMHKLHKHSNYKQTQHPCVVCGQLFDSGKLLGRHVKTHPPVPHFDVVASAFDKRVVTYEKSFPNKSMRDIDLMFLLGRPRIKELLVRELANLRSVLFGMVVRVMMIQRDENGDIIQRSVIPLRSTNTPYNRGNMGRTKALLNVHRRQINFRLEDLRQQGSNWELEHVLCYRIEIVKSRPLAGRGGVGAGGEILFNIKDIPNHEHLTDISFADDSMCFYNAVATALVPRFYPDAWRRLTHTPPPSMSRLREMADAITDGMIDTNLGPAMKLGDIPKWEKLNAHLGVAVNVLYREQDGRHNSIYPVYISKAPLERKRINLLLVDLNEGWRHYVLINNIDKFITEKYTRKRSGPRQGRRCSAKKHVCVLCLQCFSRRGTLARHQEWCRRVDPQVTRLPEKGSVTRFEAYNKRFLWPVFGAVDFEACMSPCDENRGDSTELLMQQTPMTYSLCFVNKHGKVVFSRTESDGDNCMPLFYQALKDAEEVINRALSLVAPMIQTPEVNRRWKTDENCHICMKPLPEPTNMLDLPVDDDDDNAGDESVAAAAARLRKQNARVRDHDHMNGNWLGTAHNSCNLKRRRQQTIPVYCHNWSNYDSHFVANSLSEGEGGATIKIMAYNTEKFRKITYNRFDFMDSLGFLTGSLAELTENLLQGGHTFPLLNTITADQSKKELLLRKGVFCYEYARSADFLRDCKSIPPREKFYSWLKDADVSEEDYNHAVQVFDAFGCRDMLDYCELYCKLDTLLLLESMTTFRNMVLLNFGLDSCQYISLPQVKYYLCAPRATIPLLTRIMNVVFVFVHPIIDRSIAFIIAFQLAFDAMLLKTNAELELLTDPDMVLFLQQSVRGGVSFVNDRYHKSTGEEKLLYTDAINLYGWAQVQKLPYDKFRWASKEETADIDWSAIETGGDEGFILEVDLEYPEELHDIHESLPLAPDNVEITEAKLSPFAMDTMRGLGIKRHKATKLTGTFETKRHYVVHFKTLQFYLRQGLTLKRVRRAMAFRQKDWLRPYIEMTTRMRAECASDFLKRLYKLFSNAVYGKFLQNARNFLDCHVVRSFVALSRHTSSPRFMAFRVLDADTVAVFMKKADVTLDKPYAVGFTILELSKTHVFQQYYDVFQPRLGGHQNCSVAMSDTDSFILSFGSTDMMQSLSSLSDVMDFSNYPTEHPLYSTHNRGVLGRWKDECADNVLEEYAGVRSKVYSLRIRSAKTDAVEQSSRCKGTTRAATKKLPFHKFKQCVTRTHVPHRVRTKQRRILARSHKLYTACEERQCFSSFEDKRWVLDCNRHSVPYGSYKIRVHGGECQRCTI